MISVIVPLAGDCPHRARAWQWLKNQFDGLEVVEGHGNADRWVKAEAVADGLSRASGDVLVIHDADVWADNLHEAIDAIEHHPWASPHRKVRRLTEAGTAAFLNGERDPEVQERHAAKLGGGIVVLRRETYEKAPLDPRFVGWGQEDECWAIALLTLAGEQPFIGRHELTHLYHPPQDRKTRCIGSQESKDLLRRYRKAKRAGTMRALLDEVADGPSVQTRPARHRPNPQDPVQA